MPPPLARRLVGALVAAAAGGLCLVGADEVACRRATNEVASVLAAHPGVHVAEVAVLWSRGEIVLGGIEVGRADRRLTIGRLHLPLSGLVDGFGPASAMADTAAPAPAAPLAPGPPAEGSVSADDMAVSYGAITVRIKRIDMAGTRLAQADIVAMVDPKSSVSLEDRLRKLSAKAVAIPEIAVDDTTAGSQRHALVHDVALANVVAGKASAASAKSTTLAVTDGDQAANVASGPIEAANIDLAALAHVATTRRADDKAPIEPLVDKVAVSALDISNVTRNAGVTIGSITATGVEARPLARALDAAATPAVGPGSDTTFLYADLASSVVVGTLDVADLASHGTAAGDATSLSAAQVGLQAFGGGKIGGIHLGDLRLEGAHAKLGIGSADVGSFAVPKPGADARTAARPGTLDVSRISVEITPRDAAQDKTSFTIDHVALAQNGGPTTIPASGSATVQNLGFDLAPDGVATHLLHEMGYRRATLSGALTSTYDADAQELTIHQLHVDEPAMGSLDVALRLANVSQDLLSTDPQTVQASAIAVLAKSLDLKIVDGGLFEKAIALKAQQDGIGIAEERAFGVDFFQNKLPLILGDGAAVASLGTAVSQFIASPRSLHVSLVSKQGLGVGAIGMLGDPGALLDTLDVKASAND